jgi:hypothetical protein
LAVPIRIIATEEGIFFVSVHNGVERTDDLRRRSISEVLAVELTAASPPEDVFFGVLSELYGIVEALAKLMCL